MILGLKFNFSFTYLKKLRRQGHFPTDGERGGVQSCVVNRASYTSDGDNFTMAAVTRQALINRISSLNTLGMLNPLKDQEPTQGQKVLWGALNLWKRKCLGNTNTKLVWRNFRSLWKNDRRWTDTVWSYHSYQSDMHCIEVQGDTSC